ncbi:MAG TPA: alkaline phosphatase family protein [Terriglobales bacterium]|nr:alkaline phosphatase family protein [Terriglobales bacterium]
MLSRSFLARARQHFTVAISVLTLLANLGVPTPAAAQIQTATPIKHVVIIFGENRTFDHVFATYQPKSGESVSNLLSKRIVDANGKPGPNYSLSNQYQAVVKDVFSIHPTNKTLFVHNPPVVAGGASTPYFANTQQAKLTERGALPSSYYQFLLTGGTGLPAYASPDTRIPNDLSLPSGVFQLTPGVGYDAYANSPVHRFFQMWQQLDCSAAYATSDNPSGCLSDLFPYVEVSIGAGSDGSSGSTAPPTSFLSTGEGSTAMEFYNVQQGDAPYLKFLADNYTLADNYHQAVMGGTGANHAEFGFADAIWYSDGNGNALVPPSEQIENPNPQPGTNNWYTEDGYGSANGSGGGSYVNCSDLSQPGVPQVTTYLQSLQTPINTNCESGHYYLLNNYNPAFNGDGSSSLGQSPFTIPGTSVRHIGDALNAAHLSWKYYGDSWNRYLSDPEFKNPIDTYCNICNPFQYATDIMTNPTQRQQHIQDLANFYEDVKAGELPSVSIIKPGWPVDGHPASSKLDLFEGFTRKVIDAVQANPSLWADTAIFVTFDEGGGYYDSGYVQPVDFFGDGTRVPLIIVSPFTTGGHIFHGYSDHVSLTKFIERNFGLSPLTSRSRDNYPNPQTSSNNPYVPTNTPALDDLVDAFTFSGK